MINCVTVAGISIKWTLRSVGNHSQQCWRALTFYLLCNDILGLQWVCICHISLISACHFPRYSIFISGVFKFVAISLVKAYFSIHFPPQTNILSRHLQIFFQFSNSFFIYLFFLFNRSVCLRWQWTFVIHNLNGMSDFISPCTICYLINPLIN